MNTRYHYVYILYATVLLTVHVIKKIKSLMEIKTSAFKIKSRLHLKMQTTASNLFSIKGSCHLYITRF